MIAAAEIARRHPGVRLHTHLAENQEDVDYSLKVYGVRPGEYLKCACPRWPQTLAFS
jgi:cytosine/adenosine deaminase-related metal-dependent hydrolase